MLSRVSYFKVLIYMICLNSLHAFIVCLQTECPTSIPNGRLPYSCKAMVGELCDDYICDRGYQRNVAVVALTCTESGNWNHNVSSLCLGTYTYDMLRTFYMLRSKCPTVIPNGQLPTRLPNNCKYKVDSCFLYYTSQSENLSSGIGEQHRHRSACASVQSDQSLCYLLIGKYHIKTCYKRSFNILASLCS